MKNPLFLIFFSRLILLTSAQIRRCNQVNDEAATQSNTSLIADALTLFNTGCPKHPEVVGLPTVSDLFCQFESESLNAFVRRTFSRDPPYIFRLCPDTVYTLQENDYLSAALSPTEFVCGNHGRASDRCIIRGGNIQVILRQNPVEVNHPLDFVRFRGITFQDSSSASIFAAGDASMTVEFIDCHWENIGQFGIFQSFSPSRRRRLLQDYDESLPLRDQLLDAVEEVKNHVNQGSRHLQRNVQLTGMTVVIRRGSFKVSIECLPRKERLLS